MENLSPQLPVVALRLKTKARPRLLMRSETDRVRVLLLMALHRNPQTLIYR
jgi:hypothetical protein